MAPLPRAAGRAPVRRAVGDHAGPDAGAEQRDHRVARSPAAPEPHLGLPEGLGAVVDVQGEVGTGPQQAPERHSVPVDGLAVHHRADPAGVVGFGRRIAQLDDAGHPDTHTEDLGAVHARAVQDLGQAVQDQLDHVSDVVSVIGQRLVTGGELGQDQVVQGDPDLRLPHIDADQVAAFGGHLQQDARAPPVRVDRSGLLDQAVRHELADHVADGPTAESGVAYQFVTTERALEVQVAQDHRSVASSQVTDGLFASLRHWGSLLARNLSPSKPLTPAFLTS